MNDHKYLYGENGNLVNTEAYGVPYIDREFSWLAFNDRVLGLVNTCPFKYPNPVHFAAIAESNLDEFISVRFSSMIKENVKDNHPEYFQRITNWINKQKNGISENVNRLLTEKYDEIEDGDDIYEEKIASAICPIFVGPNKEIPIFNSDEIQLFCKLTNNSKSKYCFINIPASLKRIINIHGKKGLIEHVVIKHLPEIFRGYEQFQTVVFKVTKQCDEEIDKDSSKSIVDRVNKVISNREENRIVWLDIWGDESISNKLTKLLKVQKECVTVVKSTMALNLGYTYSLFDKYVAPKAAVPDIDEPLMDYLENRAIILHHPYDSFNTVIRFIREAAEDPKVVCIRQTLYRVSGTKSPVIKALCDAARNGIKVIVMLELLARFDEKRNIKLINKLRESGCSVVYSLEGLKTHCKMCVVTRRENGGKLVNYSHISTGNYNEKTSTIYTDISYMTSNPDICKDLIEVFSVTTGFPLDRRMRSISYSPTTMATMILSELDTVRERAEMDSTLRPVVSLKINAIDNIDIIRKIYEVAENPNITFRIICRGICSLVPSRENVRIKSVVGKYLEHSRIYIFDYGGQYTSKLYISSADLLDRNLYRRIEIAVPILEVECAIKVREIFDTLWNDEVNSLYMDERGEYNYISKDWPSEESTALNAHNVFEQLTLND